MRQSFMPRTSRAAVALGSWLLAVALPAVATPAIHGADFNLSRLPFLVSGPELDTRDAVTPQVEMPRALTALPTGNMSQQWILAGEASVKIGVRQTGWCRVTGTQLVAAGLNPAAAPRSLQLFAEGKEVPIYVSGQNKARLAPTDYIEFYGLGFDIATTDTHVYWLAEGKGTGLRIPLSATAAPAIPTTTFFSTIQVQPRSNYFTLLLNGEGENFFGPLIYNHAVTQTLQVANPILSGTVANASTLEVAVQNTSQGAHTVTVQLNGVTLGTISSYGLASPVARFNVAAKNLRSGANTLVFSTGGAPSDASLLNYVRLTYPRQFQAVNNALNFVASGGQSVTVAGFSVPTMRVIDATNPNAVTEITPRVATGAGHSSISFRVPGAGAHLLLAFAGGQFTSPTSVLRNTPSSWHTSGHGADLVVISHAAFINSAAPLIAHRQTQGLAGQAVDVEDLYDEFTFGAHSPLAIKSFLARSKTMWAPAPRFVLLLGDASYDPRNYFGKGDFDFVPTKLIDTSFTETASDDWLADFNNDGLPEMAVGRISIRTAAEANAVIAKIIGYTGVAAPGQKALLVADSERGYDFVASNNEVAALFPANLSVQRINRSDGPASTVHAQVIAALNTGPLLVNFSGHGSVDIWTGAPLLTTTDALHLTNGSRLPLVICSNCLNGYFTDPTLQSIAEGLLNAPNGGAIAVWASSGDTFPEAQQQMSDAFCRLMFQTSASERPRTIGEAVVKAKAATSDLDVRRTWILFGDPSTELPTVAPVTPTPAPAIVDSQATSSPATPEPAWRWPFLPPLLPVPSQVAPRVAPPVDNAAPSEPSK